MLGFKFNNSRNKYEKISKEVFAVANSLGDEVRHTMSAMTGMPELSQDVIMTASNAATALYEYATLKYRMKLQSAYSNKYDFERQDNMMIEAFAKTLMIPPVALHKIITNQNIPVTWENILHQMPFPTINVDHYIDKVNDVINSTEE